MNIFHLKFDCECPVSAFTLSQSNFKWKICFKNVIKRKVKEKCFFLGNPQGLWFKQ